ncbi:hypothetical protein CLV46_2373 [Diaminobutyricimonas aerilata]|uniref:Streptomycin adenylyltransferase n=1 Tax=Diaminobutyricimonas aerilata TaxID=1162967 RepID=A0A2M9CLM1_9MICO|nr:hypothetical protein [Diaminobutyricimonas aerilata]PJJ72797.1 hypothetical protein CLV46_2373 [Diaminobutyricimonas aerilata]
MTASACTDDPLAAFDAYTDALVASVASRADVLGLVLLGSGAEPHRIDEWSDHDFYLVVDDGAAEDYRLDLSWLPDAERIVLAPRETEHGLKVVYDDGHVLEFAVATLGEVAGFGTNHWRVVLDRGEVEPVIRAAAARSALLPEPDPARDIRLFLAQLLIGTGRARRGELLTAGESVRGHALKALLAVWRSRVDAEHPEHLDRLDVHRRFERVYPAAAAELAAASSSEPEPAARALLEIAERGLAPGWSEWPTEAVAAIRRRLDW